MFNVYASSKCNNQQRPYKEKVIINKTLHFLSRII